MLPSMAFGAELMRPRRTEPVALEFIAGAVAAPVIEVEQQVADAARFYLVDDRAQAIRVARRNRDNLASVAAAVGAKSARGLFAAEGDQRGPRRDMFAKGEQRAVAIEQKVKVAAGSFVHVLSTFKAPERIAAARSLTSAG